MESSKVAAAVEVTKIKTVEEVYDEYQPLFCGCCEKKEIVAFVHRETGLAMCNSEFNRVTNTIPLIGNHLTIEELVGAEADGLAAAGQQNENPVNIPEVHQEKPTENTESSHVAHSGALKRRATDVESSTAMSKKRWVASDCDPEDPKGEKFVLVPAKLVRVSAVQSSPPPDVGKIYQFRKGVDINVDYNMRSDGRPVRLKFASLYLSVKLKDPE